MRIPTAITFGCILMPVLIHLQFRIVSGHAIDQQLHGAGLEEEAAEPRALKSESVLMGIANSLIGGKTKGTTGGQNSYCIDRDVYQRSARGFCSLSSLTTLSSPCKFFKMANGFCDLPDILSLSLNMSNIVLMLVLRGLIWGVSYIQGGGGGGGGKEARSEDLRSSTADVFSETDMMLFLGYLVADESDQHDCLNLVACEQPSRAESYLRSAEMVWRTAKMLDGAVPLDAKYEQMLIGLQEAIDNGKAGGDCQVRYKCFGPTDTERLT